MKRARPPGAWLGLLIALLACAPLGCGGTSAQPEILPAVPFGDWVLEPRGIACLDATHAVVSTHRAGLQFVQLKHGVSATVTAMLPTDERVDLNQASFLVAPGRLYFFNRTVGMLHVFNTQAPDAPVEIAAVQDGILGSVAAPAAAGAIVYAADPGGIAAYDFANPVLPIKGAVGKVFQHVQNLTPQPATPMALVGNILLAITQEHFEVYAFDVSNPMAPVEAGRVYLVDPARPAAKKVVSNGWAVRDNRLYIGAVQLPDPPDVKTPTAATPYVLDISDPRAPKVVAYTDRFKVGPRLIGNNDKVGAYGVLPTAADVYSHLGQLARLDLADPVLPTVGSRIYFAESTGVDSGQTLGACFAGETLVIHTSQRAAFAAVP